jgi:sugar/nucleoside kinase (ribokinase family)
MSLETLQKIRKNCKGLILLDIHSLTLGIDKNNKRFLRQPKNWKAYVKYCDILQMNKTELETLLNKKLKSNDLISETKNILKLGPKIFILTLEEDGAIICWEVGKKICLKKIAGIPIKKAVDNIGCGDVFGAAFLADYLFNKNIIESAQLANHLAAKKCQFSGVENIKNFPHLKSNFT